MTFDEEFARRFAEQFQDEDPDVQYKRPRSVSRRDLVAASYEAIIAKRRAGYSFEGIAAHFAKLGAPISVATLKSYVLRYAGGTLPARRTGSPTKGRAQAARTGAGATNKRRPSTASEAGPHSPAVPSTTGGREEMPTAAVNSNRQTDEHQLAALRASPADIGAGASAPPAEGNAAALRTDDTNAPTEREADGGANTEEAGTRDVGHAVAPQPRTSVATIERDNHTAGAGRGAAATGTVTRSPTTPGRVGNIGFVPRR